MTASWSPRNPRPKALLPEPQKRVLTYILMGYTDLDIQEKLRISQTTLWRYVTQAREAMKADTRTGAVFSAVRQGLIKIPGYTLVKDEFYEGDAA